MAAWLVARAEWRRRWLSLLVLGLVAGVAGAVVLAAVAGAHRTSSAIDRGAEADRLHDVWVEDNSAEPTPLDRPAAIDQVEVAALLSIYPIPVAAARRDVFIVAPEDGHGGVEVDRPRVRQGRLPSPGQVDAVAVTPALAADAHVGIGDLLAVPTFAADQLGSLLAGEEVRPAGPQLQLHVVGVIESHRDLFDNEERLGLTTPAFHRRWAGELARVSSIAAVGLVAGADVAVFEGRVRAIMPPGAGISVTTSAVLLDRARDTVGVLSVGLLLFAGAAALARDFPGSVTYYGRPLPSYDIANLGHLYALAPLLAAFVGVLG